MHKERIVERYLFDDIGKIMGKEFVTEFFNNYDLDQRRDTEVIDIVPDPDEEAMDTGPVREVVNVDKTP